MAFLDEGPILLAGCGETVKGRLNVPLSLPLQRPAIEPLPTLEFEITLRYFHPLDNTVEVYEFNASPSHLPRLGSVRRETPTAADLAYVEALRKSKAMPVTVDGEAVAQMRMRMSFDDDDGQKWEFSWNEEMFVPVLDREGQPVLADDGSPVTTSRVSEFRYRKEGETEWLELPPWAQIQEDNKITLCMFDEDEETGELTFWEVIS